MVIIGTDSHKGSHTCVAVDGNGRQLDVRRVDATPAGHLDLLAWAAAFPERRFALEDCRHLSRGLERDLLTAGEPVVRVPTRLMAGARRSGRERGKSDPIDALAVARAALREPDLPTARLDGPEREVRLLVDHREDLVAERTRIIERLRWHLHELMPGEGPAPRTLDRPRVIDALAARLAPMTGPVARIARDLVARVRALTVDIGTLEQDIEALVRPLAPTLLALPGCGVLTAAKLLGEVAGIDRFRSAAAFARWTGTAPVPVWSGDSRRVRLSRGGDRQANAALHRIAITQLRLEGRGRAYVEHRRSLGDTTTEAIRCLKRHLANEVRTRMLVDLRLRTTSSVVAEAA